MAATPTTARRDARRNRERLVSSARELFASAGVEVPAREIAREAGVGVGTLYRHFPEREDLVDAVLEDAFEELIAAAEVGLADPDSWSGFTGFLEAALLLHSRNRALKDVIENRNHGRTRAEAMRRRLRPLIAELVERAQADGALRQDFAPQDIALLFWASDRVIELAGDVAPEVWRRQLGFVFDGLRSGAASPLPQPPLTDAQLRRVGRG
ncbi:MAG TPA: helix-turn-helix domain-containing protein [Gaiellaceae bacterium]